MTNPNIITNPDPDPDPDPKPNHNSNPNKDDYAWEVDAVELPNLGIDGSLPELSGGKTLDEIQAQVQGTADAYEKALAEASNAIKADAAGLRGGLAGIVPDADALDGFDDYNPPEVPCCRPDPNPNPNPDPDPNPDLRHSTPRLTLTLT